jgi:hypothetical protein
MEQETQQQQSQDLGPLLLSVAAGAAAGAIAVVARKAFSGAGDGRSERGPEEGEGDETATSFEEVEQVADDLESLVAELRSEAESGDFNRLVEVADAISEYADQAAAAFYAAAGGQAEEGEGSERRVSDELMGRIKELTGGGREKAGAATRG